MKSLELLKKFKIKKLMQRNSKTMNKSLEKTGITVNVVMKKMIIKKAAI
jgi:hypothetical protein